MFWTKLRSLPRSFPALFPPFRASASERTRMTAQQRTVLPGLALALLFAALKANAQYFGQNKVRYHEHDFKILRSNSRKRYRCPATGPTGRQPITGGQRGASTGVAWAARNHSAHAADSSGAHGVFLRRRRGLDEQSGRRLFGRAPSRREQRGNRAAV